MTGTPEGSTESGFMEKPGIEPATPGLQGIALIHYTTEAFGGKLEKKNFFVAFLGINQFCRVGLRYVCWFHDGNTQRLTESGFMEKPGIEPATPGLQGIELIHYTTEAFFFFFFLWAPPPLHPLHCFYFPLTLFFWLILSVIRTLYKTLNTARQKTHEDMWETTWILEAFGAPSNYPKYPYTIPTKNT